MELEALGLPVSIQQNVWPVNRKCSRQGYENKTKRLTRDPSCQPDFLGEIERSDKNERIGS